MGYGENVYSLFGWEAALSVTYDFPFDTSDNFLGDIWIGFRYFWINLANPLTIAVIIMVYMKKNNPVLIWWTSLIALISALFWFPSFGSLVLEYFSFGYWTWLTSILLIGYYANGETFTRPKKL
jgi:hypothetical protein